MARLGRYFLPGQPLHVIQRGNNREPVFFEPEDYRRYLNWLAAAAAHGSSHSDPNHCNSPGLSVARDQKYLAIEQKENYDTGMLVLRRKYRTAKSR